MSFTELTEEEEEMLRQQDEEDAALSNGEVPVATVDELLSDDLDDEFEHVELRSKRGGQKRTVVIRALTRLEAIQVRRRKDISDELMEALFISKAMVQPRMTLKQIQAWQKKPGSVGDIQLISNAIARKSGMTEGAPKSAVHDFGE